MVKKTSADDKKRMLLKVYHTRKEPFNNKELLVVGKMAGLNDKIVPDVNSQLMDDNYVQTDKIGPSHFYWSFPGAQGAAAKKALDDAVAGRDAATARLAKAKAAAAAAAAGREDTGDRKAKLERLATLTAKRSNLEATLEAMRANDPEELARVSALGDAMKTHAVRWTENLFAVKAFLVQKKNVAAYQVDELFKSVGLPKNLDIDD